MLDTGAPDIDDLVSKKDQIVIIQKAAAKISLFDIIKSALNKVSLFTYNAFTQTKGDFIVPPASTVAPCV